MPQFRLTGPVPIRRPSGHFQLLLPRGVSIQRRLHSSPAVVLAPFCLDSLTKLAVPGKLVPFRCVYLPFSIPFLVFDEVFS